MNEIIVYRSHSVYLELIFVHFSPRINTLGMMVTEPHISCDHVLCIQQEIKIRFIC